jgi:hypothetical protein
MTRRMLAPVRRGESADGDEEVSNVRMQSATLPVTPASP